MNAADEVAIRNVALLKQALAGPDWSCKFCGGNQRNDDGNCDNCGGYRRDAYAAEANVRNFISPIRHDFEEPSYQRAINFRTFFIVGIIAFLVALAWFLFHEVDKDVEVKSTHWTHISHVDRYQVVREEGFDEDQSPSAFNVSEIGKRHHHYKQVFSHYRTEHYTVQVPDGQNCTTTPVTCSPNGNGFKTCSGGNSVCTPKTRSDPRTRKVPVYNNVSVEEMYYRWHVWKWVHNRSPAVQGDGTEGLYWLSNEQVQLNQGLASGEKERIRRKAIYKTVFTDGEDDYDYEPKNRAQYESLPIGSTHTVKYSIARGVRIPD
ncbi:hypothetical protein JKY72_02580 [Candidatus Gracilibacteria bacterium]|nr:hypothetical protein [Candidatus Gracilibacteria bacterium]